MILNSIIKKLQLKYLSEYTRTWNETRANQDWEQAVFEEEAQSEKGEKQKRVRREVEKKDEITRWIIKLQLQDANSRYYYEERAKTQAANDMTKSKKSDTRGERTHKTNQYIYWQY